jgi:exodeoxyribonuclease VII small subunit
MSDDGSSFEAKLGRIDAIVKELESGETELDRSIKLFKEGNLLVRECEALLKNAQTQIDEAMAEPGSVKSERRAGLELADDVPF